MIIHSDGEQRFYRYISFLRNACSDAFGCWFCADDDDDGDGEQLRALTDILQQPLSSWIARNARSHALHFIHIQETLSQNGSARPAHRHFVLLIMKIMNEENLWDQSSIGRVWTMQLSGVLAIRPSNSIVRCEYVRMLCMLSGSEYWWTMFN